MREWHNYPSSLVKKCIPCFIKDLVLNGTLLCAAAHGTRNGFPHNTICALNETSKLKAWQLYLVCGGEGVRKGNRVVSIVHSSVFQVRVSFGLLCTKKGTGVQPTAKDKREVVVIRETISEKWKLHGLCPSTAAQMHL